MFKQDFAYRLVKLNQVDKTMWETDFVQKVYKMVDDLEAAENNMVAKEIINASEKVKGWEAATASSIAANPTKQKKGGLKAKVWGQKTVKIVERNLSLRMNTLSMVNWDNHEKYNLL